jgi:peptidyl-tRNA hydrolase
MDAPLCKGKAASKVIDCGVAIKRMAKMKKPDNAEEAIPGWARPL